MRVENLKKQESVVESVLFTMGQSVEIRQLAAALESDEETAIQAVERLKEKYDKRKAGMQIVRLDDSYQMCSRVDYYENLIRVAATPKKQVLSDVVMETLAIIAYKQPVTKADIEKIRGVKSDHAVNRLVEYDLVYEAGRLDAPGRPALFATTEEFLRRFGVGSTEQLPEMNVEQREEIRSEVEEELNLRIDEEGHLIDEPENNAETADESENSETGMEKTEAITNPESSDEAAEPGDAENAFGEPEEKTETEENESDAIISDKEIENEIENEENSEADEEDSIS